MRYLDQPLESLSSEKFVLLSGPRQVGKTTLARNWLKKQGGRYLNWDIPSDRAAMLAKDFTETISGPALVLDEIHKYARWKSWVKGLYDQRHTDLAAVITGSARLDIYQRGGDSLLGRYELLRLHPLSVGELTRATNDVVPAPPKNWVSLTAPAVPSSLWTQLSLRSGFPEPFFKDDALQHRRWSNRRRDLLIREDIRDISQVKQLSLIEHLALLLPARVGAPLSLNSLREELGVAFDTIKVWMDILDRLYFTFRISPYSKKIARSLKKEKKLYFWDWSQVPDPGARFENMIASHLYKAIHYWNDLGYGNFELSYWRDLERREVDFIVTESGKPIVAIEAKQGDENLSSSLVRLGEALKIPQIQLVEKGHVDLRRAQSRVVSADRYLAGLV